MAATKLHNYLRVYRRRNALTQDETAALLGSRNSVQMSRYEKGQQLPTLATALAYEAVFGVPLSELFAGMYGEIKQEVEKRVLELRSRLQSEQATGSEVQVREHKLRWLDERLASRDVTAILK